MNLPAIAMALSLILVPGQGPEIPAAPDCVVLFTGNAAGALDPCDCEDGPAGGLATTRALIDSLRAVYPQAILVDTGDFLSSYERRENDSIFVREISRFGYDALCPGEYEFTLGEAFLAQRAASANLPLVSMNIAAPPATMIRRLGRGKNKIAIIALTDPAYFANRPAAQRPAHMTALNETVIDRVQTAGTAGEILIALVHAEEQALRAVGRALPPGSLLLRGHWHRSYEPSTDGVRRVSGIAVGNPGPGGRFLGVARRQPQSLEWQISYLRVAPRDEQLAAPRG